MKVEISHFERLFIPTYVTPQCPFGSLGEGTSYINTLMIYRNGIGPKCAPDVILLNLAD